MNIVCPCCGLTQQYHPPNENEDLICGRCENTLIKATQSHNRPALMLIIAALILYIPANYYPILIMTYMGRSTENTIFSGVMSLYGDGMVGLAVLVFLVSIVIPIVKILVLLYLLLLAKRTSWLSKKNQVKLLHWVDKLGPWSMLDVFLVAILVALVKLQDLARIEPGPGVVAFAGVVISTLIASQIFDSRLLWPKNEIKKNDTNSAHESSAESRLKQSKEEV
ncbi:paraquat-inducible protein A [Flocculibacter collagenilyticus]|uniref:paraquat-inducible protein A n=1 Tax=Flocculibacter collagenilyticus TaxID=2744479 RepID=UPI0018F5557E|nr:paraquat-inducible protein A [Flocculibacter collagenilyticus]